MRTLLELLTVRALVGLLVLLVVLALGGCATCERHPTACAIGAAVVVGSVAEMLRERDGRNFPQRRGVLPVSCANNDCQ